MALTSSTLAQDDPSVDRGSGDGDSEIEGRSPLKIAVDRFRRDKLSMVAFGFTALIIVIAVLSPILVKLGVLDPNSPNYDLIDFTAPGGLPSEGISLAHPLGVEPGLGRDVLSRLLLGTTLSLTIALSGAIITVVIGTVLGIIAGFSGGVTDGVIGRVIDLTLSFPSTLMLLALSGVVVDAMSNAGVPDGPDGSVVNGLYVVVVLAFFGWPPVARLMRGQVLSIREREFVDAAILIGASRWRIYFREILPNLWAPLLVYFTLLMPLYVSTEAALSYLGVGIKPPTPTLGNVLNGALTHVYDDKLFFFAPAIFIAAVVISFNLLGDGARDALDPKGNR